MPECSILNKFVTEENYLGADCHLQRRINSEAGVIEKGDPMHVLQELSFLRLNHKYGAITVGATPSFGADFWSRHGTQHLSTAAAA